MFPCGAHRHLVLIVDDDERVLASLGEVVARDGHEVETACDGRQALARIADRLPCLALVDALMPGLSGLELCARLQEDPRTRALPVIIVSGHVGPEVVAAGETAGAVDYIRKPFDPEDVRLRVRVHLRLLESKRAERALATRIEAISAAAMDAILMLDPEGRIAHWNEAATALFGYTCDEALSRDLHALLAPDRYLEAQRAAFARFQERGEGAAIGKTVELAARHRDGHEIPIELSLSAARIDDNFWAVGIVRDISARKRAEAELRASERGLRAILESLPVGVAIVGRDQRVRFVNRAALALAGAPREALVGQPCSVLCTAGAGLCPVLYRGESVERAERWLPRADGARLPVLKSVAEVEFGGEPALLEAFIDLSERKALEAQLGHARKLEAVGQLAAGIAHEINTPAQYVSDSVHFLKEAFSDLDRLGEAYRRALGAAGASEALRAEVAAAEDAADLGYLRENVPAALERCLDGLGRVARIVSAMKEFAHPDQREKSPADLNRALESTLVIARNEYKYVADVVTELGPLPPVPCHLGDLNQVFLNLIVNAAHAIAEVVGTSGARGTITLRTRVEGTWARIDVADTGCGIRPEHRERVYDPFFTTKEVGKGSGQGLAIARAIVVEKHGGTIGFESEPGRGTTFTIRLPLASPSALHPRVAA